MSKDASGKTGSSFSNFSAFGKLGGGAPQDAGARLKEMQDQFYWKGYYQDGKPSVFALNPDLWNSRSGKKAVKRRKAEKAAKEPPENNSVRVTGCHVEQGMFKIQFHITDNGGHDTEDKDGNIIKSKDCARMYYSVYIDDKDKKPEENFLHNLVTDGDGQTCVFRRDKPCEVYLYLGHRTGSKEKLPGVDGNPINEGDEAPLTGKSYRMEKETDYPEPVEVSTKRLWQPWTLSPDGRDYQMGAEGMILNPYLDSKGNATVGVGHLIHDGGFVMTNERVKRVKNDLIEKGKPLTPENFQNDLQFVLGLKGDTLKNAKAEMEFVNQMTVDQATDLYKRTDLPRETRLIAKQVYVPLYQYEYDALVDLCFNGGAHALHNLTLQKDHIKKKKNPDILISDILNTGLYSGVPAAIEAYPFSRIEKQKNLWRGKYDPGKYVPRPWARQTKINNHKYYWIPANVNENSINPKDVAP